MTPKWYSLLAIGLALGASGCERSEPAGGSAAFNGPSLDAALGAVLPVDAGPGVVSQCTRRAPRSVRSYWTPTSGQIAALEARLAPILQSALDRESPRGEPSARAGDFYRQYVGIVHRDGRQTIYVNGFHKEFAEFRARLKVPGLVIDTLRWRAEAVSACDGGGMFFGIEFDPQRNRFGKLNFNARAG